MPDTPPGSGGESDAPEDLSAPPKPQLESFEALLGAAFRAPEEAPALRDGDELGGRYVIERLVGVGGMGSVYLAQDRTLERRAAIKLHRTGSGMQRLQREAVAMARLAHPNVITVYEVRTFGSQTFVAMEYIEGTTLRGWMSEPRSFAERIAMLSGAGAGLAAAHDAGLVHRDFKPENVLIGADQRARVGDFGLARGSDHQDDTLDSGGDAQRVSESQLATPLTRPGAVLGTPAYMAPEQASGAAIDARADQFAFCVVAWEVLFGERPEHGGPRRAPRGASVRPSVRAVIERGLSARPQDRYPSMHALLAALRRASRPRWPWLAVPIVALIAGGLVYAWPRAAVVPSCDDAGREIATLHRDLPARLGSLGTPLALDAVPRVRKHIEAFEASYRADARTACRAGTIDHAWSQPLYQQSLHCLSLQLRVADLLLSPRELHAAEVASASIIASSLPTTGNCVDPATLAASPVLSADRVDDLITARANLEAAAVEARFGDPKLAREIVQGITGPIATEPTIAIRLQLVRGHLLRSDHLRESERILGDAYFGSRGIDDAEAMLASLVELISITGVDLEDQTAADLWIRNALADLERIGRRNSRAAARVLSAAASVRLVQNNVEAGLELSRRAIATRGDIRDYQMADLLTTHGEALCAVGRYDECLAAEDRALEIAREVLGPKHPAIAQMLCSFALDRHDASHGKEALELAREAREIIDQQQAAPNLDLARAENSIAAMLTDIGDDDDQAVARQMYEHASEIMTRILGPDHPDLAQIDSNLAVLDGHEHRPEAALARLKQAKDRLERSLGSDNTRVGEVEFNRAVMLRDLKRYEEALDAANHTIAIRTKLMPGTLPLATAIVIAAEIERLRSKLEHALELTTGALAIPTMKEPTEIRAWAELEHARARIALHRDLGSVRAELEDARAIYVKVNIQGRVTQCDELLAKAGAR